VLAVGALSPESRTGRVATFVLGVLAGGPIALTRLLLQDQLGATAPFVLSWPGILLAAFIGGFWPAIVVTVIGLGVGQVVIDRALGHSLGAPAIIVFCGFGLIFAAAGEARLQAMIRARRTARDMAELQTRLMNVARLNAVGEMAGSLAHELNQPLTAISNYANAAQHLLAKTPDAPPRVGELLQKVGEQAVRASEIVARVRGSVDRGATQPAAHSLSSLIQEAVEVAAAGRAGENVSIRYDLDAKADRVLADRTQVQQVVLNLVRNAFEAMADCPRRELAIGSRLGEGEVVAYVADTGPGLAPELEGRLFEPFVSGKPGGMGVGLSISRNIIEAHGGRIWAGRNATGGATFHFSLPPAESAP
jgi:C4-dicarboxylate-specific signal transduction histidine kinase